MSGHEPQIKISIPAAASRLLGALRRAGSEAYVVGGCVRDSLLGLFFSFIQLFPGSPVIAGFSWDLRIGLFLSESEGSRASRAGEA